MEINITIFLQLFLFLFLLLWLSNVLFKPLFIMLEKRDYKINGIRKEAIVKLNKVDEYKKEISSRLHTSKLKLSAEMLLFKQQCRNEQKRALAITKKEVYKKMQISNNRLKDNIEKTTILLKKDVFMLSREVIHKISNII